MKKILCLFVTSILFFSCSQEEVFNDVEDASKGTSGASLKTALYDDEWGGYGENLPRANLSLDWDWTARKLLVGLNQWSAIPANITKAQIQFRPSTFHPWKYYTGDSSKPALGTDEPYTFTIPASKVLIVDPAFIPENSVDVRIRLLDANFPGTPNAQGQYNRALATKWSRIGHAEVSNELGQVFNTVSLSSGEFKKVNIYVKNTGGNSMHSANRWELQIKNSEQQIVVNDKTRDKYNPNPSYQWYDIYWYNDTTYNLGTMYFYKNNEQSVTFTMRDIMVYSGTPCQEATKTFVVPAGATSVTCDFQSGDFRYIEWDFE